MTETHQQTTDGATASPALALLAGLNPAQREAVEHLEGPLLIVAGPGSGKTRVITHRIAYLVRIVGVSPHRVCAVTFTNKAAKEMRERLARLLGPDLSGRLTAGTFHALCARILRRDGAAIGLSRDFVIYDTDDQQAVLKRAFEAEDVDPKRFAVGAVRAAISRAKAQLIGVEAFGNQAASPYDHVVHRVYARYQAMLVQSQAVDFDDLLYKTYLLFHDHPEVLARYQERYLHLLVDEFQDTNVVQYALARQLAGKYQNICVVGDPDQAIYSWRHADVRNILNFQRDFPAAKTVRLETNYRSTPYLLQAAQGVIVANRQRIEKALVPAKSGGVPVVVTEAYNEEEEAQWVVREVDRLRRDEGFRYSDCAVLYRVNAQSRPFEEACLRYGIPYKLVGALRFYQRKEVKDAIAYLRLALNPADEVSLARVLSVPPRGIGQKTADELVRWARSQGCSTAEAIHRVAGSLTPNAAPYNGAAERGEGKGERSVDAAGEIPVPRTARAALARFSELLREMTKAAIKLTPLEVLDLVLERVGYKEFLLKQPADGAQDGEERWDNVQELRALASESSDLPPPEGLATFLERVALVSDQDNLDEAKEGLTLITLHQAKGLEFRSVFLVGMEEGLLPHTRSMDSPEELEEERRLCYVGMTRAEERLYLVRAFRRHMAGGSSASLPSRFLRDVPVEAMTQPGALARTTPQEPRLTRRERAALAGEGRPAEPLPDKPALRPGDHVRHEKFGEGVVASFQPSGSDHEVTVAFDQNGVKRLLYSVAPLEKL
ncbi:MAG: AAA family ATPase [Dehalococcoidia bacterium]|nr:AAA family ATPase [Dehalococcoidia bacterium]